MRLPRLLVPALLALAGCTSESPPAVSTQAECLRDPGCTRLMVAAHRGDHTELPENSLAAIRRAAEVGAELVEVDTRHTADEAVVLVHNSSVDGTTDGAGEVSELTLAEIRALTLSRADPDDPETQQVPLFTEALALARELGVMLYVDQKSERWDLVLAEIQEGAFFEQAVVRDASRSVLAQMKAGEPRLLVMPAISSGASIEPTLLDLPDVTIVEISHDRPWPALAEALQAAGLKVQQDVLGEADDLAASGDYSAWQEYVDSGVVLLQTDLPRLLAAAVREFNQTGVFPTSGPG